MAEVRLVDIINTTVFQDIASVNSPEKTAFFESGIVVRNGLLDQLASASGKTAELPFWNDLDATSEPNLSNDNPADVADTEKVVQGEQISRKAFLNKGWAKTDLASELAMGPKAMEHIRGRVDTYWQRQWQRRLLAASEGVMAGNIANDAGDMVHSVASEDIAGQSATTRFSRTNFIEASYTMGDMVDGITAMAVHSNIMKQMVEQDQVEDVRDADGVLLYRAYMGARIIVDDGMTVTAGATDGFKYTSILFGPGALGWGDGAPDVPVEVERDAAQGEGGGVEKLWTRKTWLLHPAGYQSLTVPAGESFSLAELRTAPLWSRVVERKNVPIAFLVSN